MIRLTALKNGTVRVRVGRWDRAKRYPVYEIAGYTDTDWNITPELLAEIRKYDAGEEMELRALLAQLHDDHAFDRAMRTLIDLPEQIETVASYIASDRATWREREERADQLADRGRNKRLSLGPQGTLRPEDARRLRPAVRRLKRLLPDFEEEIDRAVRSAADEDDPIEQEVSAIEAERDARAARDAASTEDDEEDEDDATGPSPA